jgi:hypothetical protein
MNTLIGAVAVLAIALPLGARAAGSLVERLATCQESWYDYRDDPDKMNTFVKTLDGVFRESSQDQSLVPKGRVTVAGLAVVQAFPESVGMAVGFSVVVDAPFDQAKAAVEKVSRKTLAGCQTSDGMRACGIEIAPKRTLTLLTGENGKGRNTLIGCHYFYEK